jgi:hypothetical protein
VALKRGRDAAARLPNNPGTGCRRDAHYHSLTGNGFAYDWHLTVQRIVGEDQHAASWTEFTGPEGTQPGLCFFDLADDGKITRITDFWPEPYELPASRAI